MTETVTDIIVARSRAAERLTPMLAWSIAAHAAVLLALAFMPATNGPKEPTAVMTITLGGAPGPQTGGLTQAGGRTVQAPPPPTPQPVRRAETAPAASRPEMTIPDQRARPRPQTRVENAPAPSSTSRTPTTGEQPNQGAAGATSRVRGQGFGLSSAGGGGTGLTLDVANFCCPEYLELMVTLIRRNWDQSQGIVGRTTMQFTIQRNGSIVQPMVERSSGFQALDIAAQRAIVRAQLQPLPAAFPNPTLTVLLHFDYQ